MFGPDKFLPLADRRRITLLFVIMTVVAIGVGAIVVTILYPVEFHQQRRRLLEIATAQANLIEAVADFDRRYTVYPKGPRAATLAQIITAHETFAGPPIGETGEFLLAIREGSRVALVLRHPKPKGAPADGITIDVEPDTPLSLALAGESGVTEYVDADGARVLAAYKPVPSMDMAVVAQIHISEIRRPYVHASIVALVLGLFFIGMGTILFTRVGEPMVLRLTQSENRFRKLFDNMRSGAGIFRPIDGGSDFVIEDLNKVAEQIEGVRRHESVGKPFGEVFPYLKERGMIDVFRRVNRSGLSRRLPEMPVERDGHQSWRDNFIYRLSSGEIIIVYDDVTDRVRAMQALHDSEARYRSMFEQSPAGIYIVDPETTLPLQYNHVILELLGYTAEEFAAVPIAAYDISESPDEIRDHVDELLKTGSGEFETIWKTKTGDLRNVVINVAIIEMAGYTLFHIVVTDVTERTRTEKQLRELQAHLFRVARINELGQLVSTVAHELIQPLTAAMNYVSASNRVLEKDTTTYGRRARDLATRAVEQIDRAASILRGIYQFARKEEAETTLESVNALVIKVGQLVLMGRDPLIYDIRYMLDPSLPLLDVNRVQIEQVLFNLMHNAVDAMIAARDPVMTIHSCYLDSGNIQVSISDTGSGLTTDAMEKLFQPFFTTKKDGLGLGLSISRSIIEKHGGRLWAEPNERQGAVFRFTLPTHTSIEGENG